MKKASRGDRRQKRLDVLSRELLRSVDKKVEKKAIVSMMVRGKTQAEIAETLDLSEVTVRKLQREIVEQFHDHYATNTDWWLEQLLGRYELLWKAVAPLAEQGAKDYIKLGNEILDGIGDLVGAKAAARQRDKALALADRRLDTDIQMNVIDRYQALLNQARPTVAYPVDHSPLGLSAGNDDEEDEDGTETATEVYEDPD